MKLLLPLPYLSRASVCFVALWLMAACRQPMSPPHEAPQKTASPVAVSPSAAATQEPQAQQPAATASQPSAAPSAQATVGNKKPVKMPPGAQRMTEANTLYGQRCALCHGPKGLGDGVAAANLRPQPRSFAVKKWQDDTTDDAIMEIIVKGGAAVGRSMMMPPARDLEGQDDLLRALVAVVRNFGPGGAQAAP